MTLLENKIRLRSAIDADIPFIFNSWLKSFRNQHTMREVSNEIYYTEQHKQIEKLLQNFPCLVACPDQSSEQIIGWMCAGYIESVFVVQYTYVKEPFRTLGVCRALLNQFKHPGVTGGVFTHPTRSGWQVAPHFGLIYHPFILSNDYLKPRIIEELVSEIIEDSTKIKDQS